VPDLGSIFGKPEPSPERQEFYRRLAVKGATPLWEVLGNLITAEPRTSCLPVVWHYEELRPLLLEAGELISAQEAERRVLVLENPGFPGASRITHSLYAGLQLVMPGEVTSVHRHTATAIRFIIEGEGGYTAVNGERVYMRPGDFILTPCWTSHEHGNPGDTPVVWLDGLDVPIVNLFDSSFAGPVPPGGPPGEAEPPARGFAYPYASNRAALDRLYHDGLRRAHPVDPRHGIKMFYDAPEELARTTERPDNEACSAESSKVSGRLDGPAGPERAPRGYPMPTMSAFLQLLPAGFRGEPWRATDATVYCVVEGAGRSHIGDQGAGDQTLEWREHDVFVVPSWQRASHETEREAVLFGFSDRAAQQALGLWREEH
jgi:gentisate 1,2-dioxygenase